MSNYIPHRQWHLKVAPDRRFMSYVQANFLGHPPVNNTYGIVNINGFDYAPRHQPHNILWMLPWLTWAGHNNELYTRLLYMVLSDNRIQQIGVHEASLCVLRVLEILCSSTKITFVLTLYAWCVWLFFICEFTLGSCVFTLSLRFYRVHGELKMVSNQHIVNTRSPEHTLAPICWENLKNWLNNLILKTMLFLESITRRRV